MEALQNLAQQLGLASYTFAVVLRRMGAEEHGVEPATIARYRQQARQQATRQDASAPASALPLSSARMPLAASAH